MGIKGDTNRVPKDGSTGLVIKGGTNRVPKDGSTGLGIKGGTNRVPKDGRTEQKKSPKGGARHKKQGSKHDTREQTKVNGWCHKNKQRLMGCVRKQRLMGGAKEKG